MRDGEAYLVLLDPCQGSPKQVNYLPQIRRYQFHGEVHLTCKRPR